MLTSGFLGKTVNERITYNMRPKDTIDDDEIKEEIDVVDDDSDDGQSLQKQENLQKRFMDKLHNRSQEGRQSKSSISRHRDAKSRSNNATNLRMSNQRSSNIKMLELEVDAIDDDSDDDDLIAYAHRG